MSVQVRKRSIGSSLLVSFGVISWIVLLGDLSHTIHEITRSLTKELEIRVLWSSKKDCKNSG
jgi:hypothetical protein